MEKTYGYQPPWPLLLPARSGALPSLPGVF